jgi:hypothetical protein
MKFGMSLSRGLDDYLKNRNDRLAQEVTAVVRQTATELRDDFRRQIQAKFSAPWAPGARPAGSRFQKIVRSVDFPSRRKSTSAASLVTFNAPWFAAHVEGASIRAAGSKFLVIPLPAAERFGLDRQPENRGSFGRFAAGSKAGDANIAKATARFGPLQRVRARGGRFLLLARPKQPLKRRRKASATRFTDGSIPLFLLVPAVKLRARFDVKGPADRAHARLYGRMQGAIDRGLLAA